MKSLFDLSGKVAIVTGGNGGIGKGMALGLAGAGADVVITARNEEKTAQAVKEARALGVRAHGVKVDIASKASVDEMVAEAGRVMGRIDILVANAGITLRKQPQDYTFEEWQSIIETNLTGIFLCAQAVYPWMKKTGAGKLITIGSMTSFFGGGWAAPYAASKGGVVQLTKSIAMAWAKDNIQANAVLPGWVLTEMTASIPVKEPQRYAQINSRIPAGHWAQPSDLAGIAVFLASHASDYVTGAAIPVDGGYMIA
jgi:2-deoxy-D-gluconate 3-dehydrogenase